MATPAPTAIAVKILLATLLLVIVASFFASGFHRYFTIDYFVAQQSAINDYYAVHPDALPRPLFSFIFLLRAYHFPAVWC